MQGECRNRGEHPGRVCESGTEMGQGQRPEANPSKGRSVEQGLIRRLREAWQVREQIFHGHMAKGRDKVNLSVWWKQNKGLLPREHHFLWKTRMRVT